jgi:hypothetical protein
MGALDLRYKQPVLKKKYRTAITSFETPIHDGLTVVRQLYSEHKGQTLRFVWVQDPSGTVAQNTPYYDDNVPRYGDRGVTVHVPVNGFGRWWSNEMAQKFIIDSQVLILSLFGHITF